MLTEGYTKLARRKSPACAVGYTVHAPDSRGSQSPIPNATVTDDRRLDALACVCCGEPVSHVVQFEGLRVVTFGWCDGCFSALGGEIGFEEILDQVIRGREQARRN